MSADALNQDNSIIEQRLQGTHMPCVMTHQTHVNIQTQIIPSPEVTNTVAFMRQGLDEAGISPSQYPFHLVKRTVIAVLADAFQMSCAH